MPSDAVQRGAVQVGAPQGQGLSALLVSAMSYTACSLIGLGGPGHRIIEWFRFGDDLKDNQMPPPFTGQGCQPLGQAAQDPIQPSPECLQRWGIPNFWCSSTSLPSE